MNGKDDIKELFGEKLSGFEANVRPELWANISSQITAVPAGTGMSLFTKLMIGVSAAASVGVIGFYLAKSSDSTVKPENTTENTENVVQRENDQTEKINSLVDNTAQNTENKEIKETHLPSVDSYQDLVVSWDATEATEPVKDPKKDVIEPVVSDNQQSENEPSADEKTDELEAPAATEPVLESKEPEGTIGELFNVFTPNGDGANDVLYVDSKDVTDFSVVVIDAQNKIVFQSTDADFRWDGTGLNGEPVPAGKYLYYVTARNSSGKVLSKHSVLQITR